MEGNTGESRFTFLIDTLQAVMIALAISIVIYLFAIAPNQVQGDSMLPSFTNGELVLTNKVVQWFGATGIGQSLGYDYGRNDIIVFQLPDKPDYIKRIIGLPGDEISLVNTQLYVNGEALEEPYLTPGTRTEPGDLLREGDVHIVPENNYFVLGDNRTNSKDSRYREVGDIDRSYIKGRVIFRYWPLSSFGIVH